MGGGYSHQTKGTPDALAAEIRKMKVQIDALRRSIANLGIQIDTVNNELIIGSGRSLVVNGSETVGGSLMVTGSETVSGTLSVTGSETVGGSLTVSGNETVSGTLDVTGNMIVGGTLSLPNGIINNAALNAPVYPQTAHAQAANFAVTTTATEYVRATITVPSGYSQALVFAAISANARNKNTVQDYLDGYVDIFGKNSGLDSVADGAPGYSIGISNSGSALLTGLGSSFWIRGMLLSGAANWAADSFNGINVDAIILFLR